MQKRRIDLKKNVDLEDGHVFSTSFYKCRQDINWKFFFESEGNVGTHRILHANNLQGLRQFVPIKIQLKITEVQQQFVVGAHHLESIFTDRGHVECFRTKIAHDKD
jgi:hypothetical protein